MRRALPLLLVAASGCWDFHQLGQSICDTSTSALCDDFELGTIDNSKWRVVVTPMSVVTVDRVHAHSGSYAMHATLRTVTNPTGILAIYSQLVALPNFTASPNVDLRAWYFVPADESTRLAGYFGPSMESIDLFSSHQLVGTADSVATTMTNRLTGTLGPTLGVWTCVEIWITSGSPSGTHVFVNGVNVPELAAPQNVVTNPPLDTVSFGSAQTVAPFTGAELFVDDVVISRTGPIGCGPDVPSPH